MFDFIFSWIYFPDGHLSAQINFRNNRIRWETSSKLTIKTSLTSFSLYCWLWTDFTSCSVSIVDFKQKIANWLTNCQLTRFFFFFINKHNEASVHFSVYTAINVTQILGKIKKMFYLASLTTAAKAYDQKIYFFNVPLKAKRYAGYQLTCWVHSTSFQYQIFNRW